MDTDETTEARVRRAYRRHEVEFAIACERALQPFGRLKNDRHALDRWADDGGRAP